MRISLEMYVAEALVINLIIRDVHAAAISSLQGVSDGVFGRITTPR